MRDAWEFATLICCGNLVLLNTHSMTMRCPHCGVERRLADLSRWDSELTDTRIMAQRDYAEKRGTICLDKMT